MTLIQNTTLRPPFKPNGDLADSHNLMPAWVKLARNRGSMVFHSQQVIRFGHQFKARVGVTENALTRPFCQTSFAPIYNYDAYIAQLHFPCLSRRFLRLFRSASYAVLSSLSMIGT